MSECDNATSYIDMVAYARLFNCEFYYIIICYQVERRTEKFPLRFAVPHKKRTTNQNKNGNEWIGRLERERESRASFEML